MYTHLDLIFDQLDTLQELLQRESRALNSWVAAQLNGWDQDDYHTLIQQIDSVGGDMSPPWAGTANGTLRTQLFDIREFAAVLLNTQHLASAQEAQLRSIHLTSADLLDIVDQIAQT
jgi:hypothetical protein